MKLSNCWIMIFAAYYLSACSDGYNEESLKEISKLPPDSSKVNELVASLDSAYISDGFSDFFKNYDKIQNDFLDGILDTSEIEKKSTEYEIKFKNLKARELNIFMEKWRNELPPIPENKINSEIIRDIYQIHRQVFNFDSSNPILKKNNLQYRDAEYLIIPTRLFVSIETNSYDSTRQMITKDFMIDDFRPEYHFNFAKIVYLNPEYEEAIVEFLSDEYIPLGTGGIMNTARASGESKYRLFYLTNCFFPVHGHWGGYWHLATFPKINKIIFSKDLKKARVEFRNFFSGSTAIFEKQSCKWKLINTGIYWTE